MLTQQRLKELLHYNAETGVFTKIQSGKKADFSKTAKTKNQSNMIQIDYKNYKTQDLAWLYMKGYIPSHIHPLNTDKRDVRWKNISEKIITEINIKGVTFNKQINKWNVKDRTGRSVGMFYKLNDAVLERYEIEKNSKTGVSFQTESYLKENNLLY